jgi:hypothetical protein
VGDGKYVKIEIQQKMADEALFLRGVFGDDGPAVYLESLGQMQSGGGPVVVLAGGGARAGAGAGTAPRLGQKEGVQKGGGSNINDNETHASSSFKGSFTDPRYDAVAKGGGALAVLAAAAQGGEGGSAPTPTHPHPPSSTPEGVSLWLTVWQALQLHHPRALAVCNALQTLQAARAQEAPAIVVSFVPVLVELHYASAASGATKLTTSTGALLLEMHNTAEPSHFRTPSLHLGSSYHPAQSSRTTAITDQALQLLADPDAEHLPTALLEHVSSKTRPVLVRAALRICTDAMYVALSHPVHPHLSRPPTLDGSDPAAGLTL